MKDVLEFLSVRRFYVFFADGTWRTCTNVQWKEEQIWKLKPIVSGWVGCEFDAKVISAVIERFQND